MRLPLFVFILANTLCNYVLLLLLLLLIWFLVLRQGVKFINTNYTLYTWFRNNREHPPVPLSLIAIEEKLR